MTSLSIETVFIFLNVLENKIIFKISQNLIIYKMTLLQSPRSSGMTSPVWIAGNYSHQHHCHKFLENFNACLYLFPVFCFLK